MKFIIYKTNFKNVIDDFHSKIFEQIIKYEGGEVETIFDTNKTMELSSRGLPVLVAKHINREEVIGTHYSDLVYFLEK